MRIDFFHDCHTSQIADDSDCGCDQVDAAVAHDDAMELVSRHLTPLSLGSRTLRLCQSATLQRLRLRSARQFRRIVHGVVV